MYVVVMMRSFPTISLANYFFSIYKLFASNDKTFLPASVTVHSYSSTDGETVNIHSKQYLCTEKYCLEINIVEVTTV